MGVTTSYCAIDDGDEVSWCGGHRCVLTYIPIDKMCVCVLYLYLYICMYVYVCMCVCAYIYVYMYG